MINLELLAMVRHFVRLLEVSPKTLALEAIDAVGPGGHFLQAEHTLQTYRQAHFLPYFSRRQTYAQWQAGQRCRNLLAGYVRPPQGGAARVARLRSEIQSSRYH